MVHTTKAVSDITIKDEDKGEVEAVFATFNVIDKDGDVILPEAIKDGTEVAISAYQHSIWDSALPVGKGTIHKTDTEAIVKASFFLNTQSGRDHFEVVKAMGAEQQWSFGFTGESETRDVTGNGDYANVFTSIDAYEVSPVLIGAGVNTRTIGVKGVRFVTEAQTVLDAVRNLVDRAASIVARRAEEKGKGLGVESAEILSQLIIEAERAKQVLEPAEAPADDTANIDYTHKLRALKLSALRAAMEHKL